MMISVCDVISNSTSAEKLLATGPSRTTGSPIHAIGKDGAECSRSNHLTLYTAVKFIHRLRGLLGYRQLNSDEALLIDPCSDIHTFGMGYSLDVAFIDERGVVLKLVQVKPNRIAVCRQAKAAIEFCAGGARNHGVEVGAQINTGAYTVHEMKTMETRK